MCMKHIRISSLTNKPCTLCAHQPHWNLRSTTDTRHSNTRITIQIKYNKLTVNSIMVKLIDDSFFVSARSWRVHRIYVLCVYKKCIYNSHSNSNLMYAQESAFFFSRLRKEHADYFFFFCIYTLTIHTADNAEIIEWSCFLNSHSHSFILIAKTPTQNNLLIDRLFALQLRSSHL